jgi:predicted Zn-dependent peptidase
MCSKTISFILSFAFCIPLTQFAQDPSIRWKNEKLANGLTFLYYEDHSAPLISHHIYVGAGSRTERPGITGISHLIEHLRWGGNATEEPFEKRLQALGGSTGGHTWPDFTDYVDIAPSSTMEMVVREGALFLGGLRTDEERFKAERDVVLSEMMLAENNPYYVTLRYLWAGAFEVHPYRHPVVGWYSDVSQITLKDVKDYFSSYYSPQNTVILLAGDFDPSEASTLVQKYYGVIPRGPEPPRSSAAEVQQNAEKRVRFFSQAGQPAVFVGCHIPGLTDPDAPALQIMDALLCKGTGARLQKSLVDQQHIAVAINPAGGEKVNQWRKDPSLLVYGISLQSGCTPEQGENALLAELDNFGRELIDSQEVDRAIRRETTDQLTYIFYTVWTLWSISSRTQQAGFYQTVANDPEYVSKLISSYQQVKPEDIQRVARKYLNNKNRTIVLLIPPSEANQ